MSRGKLEIGLTLGRSGQESAVAQARRILEELKSRLTSPEKKVAILYSANDIQARALHAANSSADAGESKKIPSISGSGQALVFAELIKLINEENKRGEFANRIRILPIATSLYGGTNGPGNMISLAIMKRDLKTVQSYLKNGYDVLGLPKTLSKEKSTFAIGGSASKYWFAQDYVAIKYGNETVSQGQFVQDQLDALVAGDDEEFDTNLNAAQLAGTLSTRFKYQYATDLEKNRFHALAVTTKGFANLKKQYEGLTGDHLKTQVLCDFKRILEGCVTTEAVDEAVAQFKQTDEWKILQKAQGLTTLLLGCLGKKTSSVCASEALIEERKQAIEESSLDNRPK